MPQKKRNSKNSRAAGTKTPSKSWTPDDPEPRRGRGSIKNPVNSITKVFGNKLTPSNRSRSMSPHAKTTARAPPPQAEAVAHAAEDKANNRVSFLEAAKKSQTDTSSGQPAGILKKKSDGDPTTPPGTVVKGDALVPAQPADSPSENKDTGTGPPVPGTPSTSPEGTGTPDIPDGSAPPVEPAEAPEAELAATHDGAPASTPDPPAGGTTPVPAGTASPGIPKYIVPGTEGGTSQSSDIDYYEYLLKCDLEDGTNRLPAYIAKQAAEKNGEGDSQSTTKKKGVIGTIVSLPGRAVTKTAGLLGLSAKKKPKEGSNGSDSFYTADDDSGDTDPPMVDEPTKLPEDLIRDNNSLIRYLAMVYSVSMGLSDQTIPILAWASVGLTTDDNLIDSYTPIAGYHACQFINRYFMSHVEPDTEDIYWEDESLQTFLKARFMIAMIPQIYLKQFLLNQEHGITAGMTDDALATIANSHWYQYRRYIRDEYKTDEKVPRTEFLRDFVSDYDSCALRPDILDEPRKQPSATKETPKKGSHAVPADDPRLKTVYKSDTNETKTTVPAPAGNTVPETSPDSPTAFDINNPSSDLQFPDEAPPNGQSHCTGRWVIGGQMLTRTWWQYRNANSEPLVVSLESLPANTSTDPSHWIGRKLPNGQNVTNETYIDIMERKLIGKNVRANRKLFTSPEHREQVTSSTKAPAPDESLKPGTYRKLSDQEADVNDLNKLRGTYNAQFQNDPGHRNLKSVQVADYATTVTQNTNLVSPPVIKNTGLYAASTRMVFYPPPVQTASMTLGQSATPRVDNSQIGAVSYSTKGHVIPRLGRRYQTSSDDTVNLTNADGGNPNGGNGFNPTQYGGIQTLATNYGGTNLFNSNGQPNDGGSGFNGDSNPPNGNNRNGGSGRGQGRHPNGGDGGGDGGGGGGNDPPAPPFGTGGSFPPPAPDNKFKPDSRMYKNFSDQAKFQQWFDQFRATTIAFGLGAVLDEDYNPDYRTHPREFDALERAQAWLFSVLSERVKTVEGEAIISAHTEDLDARQVIRKLIIFARKSATTTMQANNLMTQLTQLKISTWRGTAHAFITRFLTLAATHNRLQTDRTQQLPPNLLKSMLENAVSSIKELDQVRADADYRMVTGQVEAGLLYHEYIELLKNRAMQYDNSRQAHRRQANAAESFEDTLDTVTSDTPTDASINNEIIEYAVQIVTQSQTSRMNRSTWKSLSPEGQTTWDQMTDVDKAKILNYAQDRASRRSDDPSRPGERAPRRQANVSSVTDTDATPDETPDASEDTPATNSDPDTATLEVHQIVSQARRDAHPGDPRRVLSKCKPNPKRQANVAYTVNVSDFTPRALSGGMAPIRSDDDSDYNELPPLSRRPESIVDSSDDESDGGEEPPPGREVPPLLTRAMIAELDSSDSSDDESSMGEGDEYPEFTFGSEAWGDVEYGEGSDSNSDGVDF